MGGGGSLRSEILGGAIDRKRINYSTSRVFTCKDKDYFPSTSAAKSQLHSRSPDVESKTDSERSGRKDVKPPNGEDLSEEQNVMVESAAEMLYGLIHVHYILTTQGMDAMMVKYKNNDFGRCPRVFCCGQSCLPVGQSDAPCSRTVKIYCPNCEDIYYPPSKFREIDGAYFGTSFPHLFLMTYGNNMQPQKPSQNYVPKIFGFKLHNKQ